MDIYRKIKRQKIVYIVPTYNEKENIRQMLYCVYHVLLRYKKYDFNLVVVDDNSPDGTGNVVNKFIEKHPKTILLSGNKNGLGMAMIRGIKYAIKKLNADFVISNEADFSYDPRKVSVMIKKFEKGYDFVLGSRRLENTNKWPLKRRLIHFVANNFFAGIVAGINQIEDHNSAFKGFRVKGVLDKINFKNFPKGFSFFNYLTYIILEITPKFYEFKTVFSPRTKGISKMMIGESKEYIISCLRIRKERIYKTFCCR